VRYRLDVGDLDEPRFLGAKLGYTHVAHRSIDPSAECVSETEQRRQTVLAHREWRVRRQRAWIETRGTIDAALDAFVVSVGNDHALAGSVRAVRRSCDAVARKVASAP
jgi:hypothetical protein